ncbi:serine hydroxymethyltransferase [Candidatus Babeliales bacterium]|nr:serine hydroxymethyltransferase [Candidatus Babeliales bacterium]
MKTQANQKSQAISHVFDLIDQEKRRQEETICLIASENYASPQVLEASGSVLTNKYAEGYPGRRYYAGCQVVDEVENAARDLGKQLFNAEHLNVQPHSGSSANFAVYMSKLKPGDTVLGMHINAGGHLTHGHKLNFSGKLFNFVPYGVSPEDERIDYDELEILANQHQPKMIVAGASAYSRFLDFKRLAQIATDNHALLLVDMAHIAGLVAAGVHPNPVPYADIVTSTTHKTLRGPRGGMILSKADHAPDIDRTIIPGTQGGPLMHVVAAKAVCFAQALEPSFKTYQEQVVKNAKAMAHAFGQLGYRIVAGGTDNHLFLVDLQPKNSSSSIITITGKLVEETLEKCGIMLNRNLIPFDTQGPMIASGIRIGTPAVTTRGFKEHDVVQLVHWIDEAVRRHDDDAFLKGLKAEVSALCKRFPVYN